MRVLSIFLVLILIIPAWSAEKFDPDKLTLKQKIGQLFIFGVKGKTVSGKLKRHLETHQPGGIIVFSHNIKSIKQITKFNSDLYNLNYADESMKPFIAVDQEGGTVSRIKIRPRFPSALAIGSTERLDLAERIGYLTGEILRTLGFNMNLAPVLDISDPLSPNFMGTRSFGKNPHKVAAYASAYAKGLMMADVLPTGKHFPGHGNTVEDSHKMLPVRNLNLKQLSERDLVPFAEFAKIDRPTAMMVAHVAYPLIDASRYPASYSKPLIQNLLQERLGYKGLVITDDLDMEGAVIGKESFLDRVKLALHAGSDMVMIAWSRKRQIETIKGLEKAVLAGEFPEELIDQKLHRIHMVKSGYLHPYNPNTKEVQEVLTSNYIRETFREIAEINFNKSIRALSDF